MYVFSAVKDTNCTWIIAYTESVCNITGRFVWLLLANAVFLTVIAEQACESYFRLITLIVFLSAQMEDVSIPYTTHKLILLAKRNAVSNGKVVVNSIIVSF